MINKVMLIGTARYINSKGFTFTPKDSMGYYIICKYENNLIKEAALKYLNINMPILIEGLLYKNGKVKVTKLKFLAIKNKGECL